MSRAVYVGPWRVDLDRRDGVEVPVSAARLTRAVGAALDAGGAPAPASIGLILSNDAELAGLNAEHLHEHGPTDVLSFPLLSPEAFPSHVGRERPRAEPAARAADARDAGVRGSNPAFVLPPRRRLHLGDIVVSVERATAQAVAGRGGQSGDTRWSPADEMLLLVTHGTLHLCGWDHAESAEEAAMRALEARLLAIAR